MKGYKAFNKDLTCRGFQYEIGKEYTFDGKPICCKQGFHFCATIADCNEYYNLSKSRVCEIEATGDIVAVQDKTKYCTNKIKIIREVDDFVQKTNISDTSVGLCNAGKYNKGNYNSGKCNVGDSNTGYRNLGSSNTGSYNIGEKNTGDGNTGSYNTGNCNIGDLNVGSFNDGHKNVGDYNTGWYNLGYWNSGWYNTGVFCTKDDNNPKIKIFDVESDWTINDWNYSAASVIMRTCPQTYIRYVWECVMSEQEKIDHPEYEITGGYLKRVEVTNKEKQEWWGRLSLEDQVVILSLPNFNREKFKMCTGIDVGENWEVKIQNRGKNNG